MRHLLRSSAQTAVSVSVILALLGLSLPAPSIAQEPTTTPTVTPTAARWQEASGSYYLVVPYEIAIDPNAEVLQQFAEHAVTDLILVHPLKEVLVHYAGKAVGLLVGNVVSLVFVFFTVMPTVGAVLRTDVRLIWHGSTVDQAVVGQQYVPIGISTWGQSRDDFPAQLAIDRKKGVWGWEPVRTIQLLTVNEGQWLWDNEVGDDMVWLVAKEPVVFREPGTYRLQMVGPGDSSYCESRVVKVTESSTATISSTATVVKISSITDDKGRPLRWHMVMDDTNFEQARFARTADGITSKTIDLTQVLLGEAGSETSHAGIWSVILEERLEDTGEWVPISNEVVVSLEFAARPSEPVSANPVPNISNLNPSSATQGGETFTVTVNGSGFVPGVSAVRWNGSDLPTAVDSGSRLQATLSSAELAEAGYATVTVFNGSPGGGTSNGVSFSIVSANPVPIISSLAPSSATTGGDPFTLTVKGSGFASGVSTVRWNGSNLTTAFVSDSQLQASISSDLIAAEGSTAVTVFNRAPGGGTSSGVNLSIVGGNPVPSISSLDPSSASAGGDKFTLTVNGSGFVSGVSTVRWNGSDLTTAFAPGSQLWATVSSADIAEAGSATVTVFNRAPGGGASDGIDFSIFRANPVPKISSLAPSSATAGGEPFTLAVNGSGFVAGVSTVRWNGSDLTTGFVSDSELWVNISAAEIAEAGAASVTVFNSPPGGGESDVMILTVEDVPEPPVVEPPEPPPPPPPEPVVPEPPAPVGSCTDNAAFVADVTVPDGTTFEPVESFEKTWRVKNTGTCAWESGYRLVFVSGEKMGAGDAQTVDYVAAGDTTDITVRMTAPDAAGRHEGTWRMVAGEGAAFGQTMTVVIHVGRESLTQIAYSRGFPDGGIWVVNSDGSGRRQLTSGNSARPVWSPNGEYIVFLTGKGLNKLTIIRRDGSDPRQLGKGDGSFEHVWSPSGDRIAFVPEDGQYQVYVGHVSDGRVEQLTHEAGWKGGLSWSPDGRYLALGWMRNGVQDDIYLLDPDSKELRSILQSPDALMGPRWSPDGSRIAFGRYNLSERQMCVMDSDGSNVHCLADQVQRVLQWSPDGRRILFIRDKGNQVDGRSRCELYAINADGTGLTLLIDGCHASWSPDSTHIVVHGNGGLYVIEADGGTRGS